MLKIIAILREEPNISQEIIGERLGTTRRVIQKKIKLLRETGRIERVGGKRYGHWIIHELKPMKLDEGKSSDCRKSCEVM